MFVEAYVDSVFPVRKGEIYCIVHRLVVWHALRCTRKKNPAKQPKGIILCSSGLLDATGPRSILRSVCVALVLGAQQKTYMSIPLNCHRPLRQQGRIGSAVRKVVCADLYS